MKYESLRMAMPPRLDELLRIMHARWRHWSPNLGHQTENVLARMGASGGCREFEDLEESTDDHAIAVLEAAWGDLLPSERIAVEVVFDWMADVATMRGGLDYRFLEASRKMELRLKSEGVLL